MTHWLAQTERQSKLLQAILDPQDFTILYGNEAFCRLTGLVAPEGEVKEQNICLFDLFADFDAIAREKLYRLHLLPLVLRDICGIEADRWRLLEEPQTAILKSALEGETRTLQFWLRSQHLRVERIDPDIDEFADMDLQNSAIPSQEALEAQIQWDNYRLTGQLLWEGLDVSDRETLQNLIHALIDPQDITRDPEAFSTVARLMRSLFRTSLTAILSLKRENLQFFTCQDDRVEAIDTLTWETFADSHLQRAIQANRIWNVPNLHEDCPSAIEAELWQRGCRSLLLIPLRWESPTDNEGQLLGMVILGSDRRDCFDRLDALRAQNLIAPLKTALRQANREHFSRVHPSVAWRFQQESERRSLGLAPERIVFEKVYPLYSMSDIRGSSKIRNQAIQTDLLAQFNLALAIVDAALASHAIAFLQQLRTDLLAYMDRIAKQIRVEDETMAQQYLQEHIEVYFPYFRQCGETAIAAIAAYEKACENDHQCIYDAREDYDRAIGQINTHLRETWRTWQQQMQEILSHYCDIEVTDGIDSMMYVGSAIASQFSLFHLHSLRYEQLRAVCDCARTCFAVQRDYNLPLAVSHLVLVQDTTIDIFHDEHTEKLFDVVGTKDTRYEIVKKRIDKGIDAKTSTRITQPGMLTIAYSTEQEWAEYHQYLRYLVREGWIDSQIESGAIEPLPGVTGLKFARVKILDVEE
ncbi:MAG: GAF domain-containing protein [Cyanobacteria bacterium P01_E01_bin.42]